MQLGVVSNIGNFALDYSFVREYASTQVFRDFFMLVSDGSQNIYVGKDFKLLHHCVTHQGVDKDNVVSTMLRDLLGVLLGSKRLREVSVVSSIDYIREIDKIDDICLITTRKSILFKRMFNQKLKLSKPILLFSDDGCNFYNDSDDCYANTSDVVISPLAAKNSFLDSHVFCNVGDTVQTDKKKDIVLSDRISNGAEGMIFRTNDSRLVAKIYHRGNITPLRWSKLSKMVSMGIDSAEICWPKDLLFYKGVPVGYTMRLGKGSTLSNILDGPDAVMSSFPEWNRIDIVDTLISLLEKYLYMHLHDIVVGDIQLKNALLYNSKSVYLIDMDSSQIDNLPCPVGTEEFTPPELWGRNFVDFLRTLSHEDYCIAMLVFSVLFCGLHPYARRNGKETLREEILEKTFPYRLDNSNVDEIPIGGYNFIWEYLPENLRIMLYDVFALGKRHEAIEWYAAVVEYKDMLLNKKFEDSESYKVFPKMEYKKPVVEPKPDQSKAYKPGGVSFKDRVIYTNDSNPFAKVTDPVVGNPFAAAANGGSSPFTAPSTPTPRPASPFVPKGEGTKPTDTPSDQKPDEPKKGGLFSRFKK